MLISDVLRAKGSGCETLQPNNRVATAVKVLAERGIGAVVVTETDGRLVGIFSERDLVKLLARDGAAGLERELRETMTRPVVTGRPEDRIEDAMAVMTQRHIRHLPVMQDGRLAGMVSIRDLVRRRLSERNWKPPSSWTEPACTIDPNRGLGPPAPAGSRGSAPAF